tara:strand:- start:28 stop:564 length:537 start_codon:yes stop_codon:yes gene_type:complete
MIKAQDVYNVIEGLRLKFTGKKVNLKSMYFKYQRTNVTIKSVASNLASRINSSHFTIKDLKSYIYHYHIFEDGNIWFNIKPNDISESEKQFFSEVSLKNDKKILLEVNKSTKFNNIAEYFQIHENGENYASLLIFNKYISPCFYLKYMDYQKIDKKENKRQNKLTQVMQVIKGEMKNG